jgi:hypothetical protein
MSILIVGAGATGGYFGGRLAQAGRDVTFLVLERRAADLREHGLRLVSSGSTEVIKPKVVTPAELAAGAFTASTVLVTVKAAGLDPAIGEIAPAVGPDTTIVPVLNGMRHMDMLNAAFGPARVLGGIALLATQLDSNGNVTVLSPDASLTIGAQDRPDPAPASRGTKAAAFPPSIFARSPGSSAHEFRQFLVAGPGGARAASLQRAAHRQDRGVDLVPFHEPLVSLDRLRWPRRQGLLIPRGDHVNMEIDPGHHISLPQ